MSIDKNERLDDMFFDDMSVPIDTSGNKYYAGIFPVLPQALVKAKGVLVNRSQGLLEEYEKNGVRLYFVVSATTQATSFQEITDIMSRRGLDTQMLHAIDDMTKSEGMRTFREAKMPIHFMQLLDEHNELVAESNRNNDELAGYMSQVEQLVQLNTVLEQEKSDLQKKLVKLENIVSSNGDCNKCLNNVNVTVQTTTEAEPSKEMIAMTAKFDEMASTIQGYISHTNPEFEIGVCKPKFTKVPDRHALEMWTYKLLHVKDLDEFNNVYATPEDFDMYQYIAPDTSDIAMHYHVNEIISCLTRFSPSYSAFVSEGSEDGTDLSDNEHESLKLIMNDVMFHIRAINKLIKSKVGKQ